MSHVPKPACFQSVTRGWWLKGGGGSIIGPIKVEQVICKWNQSSLEVSVPRHLMSLNLNVRVRVRVSGLNSLFYIVSFYCLLACTLISL